MVNTIKIRSNKFQISLKRKENIWKKTFTFHFSSSQSLAVFQITGKGTLTLLKNLTHIFKKTTHFLLKFLLTTYFNPRAKSRCVKNNQIGSFFWSVFEHFARSVRKHKLQTKKSKCNGTQTHKHLVVYVSVCMPIFRGYLPSLFSKSVSDKYTSMFSYMLI